MESFHAQGATAMSENDLAVQKDCSTSEKLKNDLVLLNRNGSVTAKEDDSLNCCADEIGNELSRTMEATPGEIPQSQKEALENELKDGVVIDSCKNCTKDKICNKVEGASETFQSENARLDVVMPYNEVIKIESENVNGIQEETIANKGDRIVEEEAAGLGLEDFPSGTTIDNNLSKLLPKMVIKDSEDEKEITFIQYKSEEQLPDLVALITIDLSEPYSVYTYRYFLHNWPHLSHLAYHGDQCVGAIVCKLDIHRKSVLRGYIAMLVVHRDYRRCKIGSSLVKRAVRKMIEHGCEEVVLETEVTNKAALKLYENLGFIRDKRLLRYYLNGVDAWRLKLWLK
eukprot:Seg5446.2 transcript_id=Seg5446.2/GoldUCD/mRNA.D3Y31 product="N-alpha-acetyltransferase 30" protein_id=Seg5446.2/GoldUCD/D3Y31